MGWKSSIKEIWEALDKSDQKKLKVFATLLSSTGLLDLFTVLILGSAATIAYRTAVYDQKPSKLEVLFSKYFNLNFDSLQLLFLLSVLAVGLLFLKNLINLILNFRFIRYLTNLEVKLSLRAFGSFMNLSGSNFYKLTASDYQWILNTAPNRIIAGFILPIINLITDLVSTLFLILVAFLVSPLSTSVVSFVVVIIYIYYTKFISSKNFQYGFESRKESINLNNLTNSIYSGLKDIKIYGIENLLLAQFKQRRKLTALLAQKSQWINSLFRYLTEFLIIFSASFITIIEVLRTDFRHSITTLVIFLAVGFRLIPVSQRLQSTLNSLRLSTGLVDNYLKFNRELINSSNQNREIKNSAPINLRADNSGIGITFENVGLKFKNRTILEKVNFEIRPGELVLIVGESGAGKTSIVDLITGFIEPTEGKIKLTLDEKVIDKGAYLFCGYANQQPLIVNGTLRENLSFFKQASSQKELSEIIEVLNLSEIDNRSDRISSEAFTIKDIDYSGGEKLRIGIGRAFLSQMPLLIFDEPTNSLDENNRLAIVECILQKSKAVRTTIIIVTHTPKLFPFANKIIEINSNKVFVKESLS